MEQPLDGSSPVAKWLEDTQSNLKDLEDSLMSWPRVWRAIAAIASGQVVGAAIGLWLASLGKDSVTDVVLGVKASTVLTIVAIAFFPVLYTMLIVSLGFSLKRILMLTVDLPLDYDGRQIQMHAHVTMEFRNSPGQYKVIEPVPSGDGVYGAERALAHVLTIRR